jgi:ubiquinone/menaquinone biosynthesis C-methylase UbiE
MKPSEALTKKAQYYHKYRPKYSEEIITILTAEITLHPSPSYKIADIGSGTGFLSELFLKNDNTVYGVEPNDDMRGIAEDVLSGYPNFISVNGTAEATTIGDKVDAISTAQSFNWFDIEKARTEFQRILKPNGYVITIFDQ